MNGLNRKVHFIGVGGIGMSGLAEILLNLGHQVSGSDIEASEITGRLAKLGLSFHRGHDPAHIEDAEIVVVSAAIGPDNPETAEARRRGIPVIHRSDLLADLIRLKPNAVVVGGSHGKTTTTSMIAAILDCADIEATSVVGGILHHSGTNARWGKGDCIVAEADEHDGSFLRLHPTIAVVTNIDAEHLEYYGTVDKIQRAFTDFCNGVPFYGYSIICRDDPLAREILDDVHSVALTYGLEAGASLVGSNLSLANLNGRASKVAQLGRIRTRMEVVSHDARFNVTGSLGVLETNAVGRDNARNALGACAVGLCLGMDFDTIAKGMLHFDGVRRRLQLRGEAGGAVIVEDYAHHPTEIASTLEAIRWLEPSRVLCVFQPHLYSRTKFFFDDFAAVLGKFDRAIVTDIYPSREAPMAGVDSGLIVDAARANGADHVELVSDMSRVPSQLVSEVREGDVILVLGAGNINRIVEPLLSALEGR